MLCMEPKPMVSQRAARVLCHRLLSAVSGGTLVVEEEGGRQLQFGRGEPVATLQVRSPALYPALLRGSRGLASAYAKGLWESPDLVGLVRLAARNAQRFDRLRRYLAPLREPYQLLLSLVMNNSRHASKRAIAAHYDLSNELFAAMSYSCLYFPDPYASLEEAAEAKLELVSRKLALNAADHVLEIGAGWGSFAFHAASKYGCRVTAVTLSEAQASWMRREARRRRLDRLVEVVVSDYRDLRGQYDKLCSIEMVEAVGHRGLGRFLERCSRLLKPDGLMLMQAIVIDDRAWRVERISRSFIRTMIFPEGSLPSQERIARAIARHTDMQTVEVTDLTPHYVPTLAGWRERFEAAWERLRSHGFDERFRRLWRLYLAYCQAGFAERRIEDKQFLFAKPLWRPQAAVGGRLRPATAL
jgi:cyclopropane-fatty-acyl-phospholipid synthase